MGWTTDDMPDLTGRTAVVTGANAGLGLEITSRLAGHGARVIMACRNLDKAGPAAESIRARQPDARVEVARLDLADLASVKTFVDALHRQVESVDLLIANAGLMAIDRSRTVDGFEMQFGVNHLGHFVLATALADLLENAPAARVATMTSGFHHAGRMRFDDLMGEQRYGRWAAYCQSKLANLLFTAELQRRLSRAGARTIAVAAHPGGARTELGSEGTGISNRISALVGAAMSQSAAGGALPMLRAATDPDVTGGQFFGPKYVSMGPPVLTKPSRRARREDDARRLWNESVALTGHDLALEQRA